ncbi:hypothetical protein AWN90_25590 [Nocardia terpenica]|uniref:Uncharacterized protein n=1 Tax=Nocardia terpenica TaxID=455432 RepID=A0A164NK07_9NOCA|nr:hypothetical protein AWN90_25590 [Nocardia terpenica]NQE92945.1 hypothetical protein [Nocardia terpenica]
MGWIDTAVSIAPEWEAAQVRRLARLLGYVLIWSPEDTSLPLVDQVRAADVDAVITPASAHLDAIMLHSVMCIADVETACPRMSFSRWAAMPPGRLG